MFDSLTITHVHIFSPSHLLTTEVNELLFLLVVVDLVAVVVVISRGKAGSIP